MDINQIKNKLQSLQQKSKPNAGSGGEKKNIFWKPSVGKQTVRVVPSKFNKDNPFTELKFHYGVGNKTMISPDNFGEKDPIIEFAKQLSNTNDKENWKLSKKLYPKMRIFLPVIVRGEEDQGVKLWGFGKELYMDFLNLVDNEDIGDFTDIVNGRDIIITTVGPDVTGTEYNKSNIMPRTKETPLSEDNTLVDKWLENQPNPKESFKRYTYDEMRDILQGWLVPENAEGEDEVGTTLKEIKPNSSTKAEKIDALFND